MPFIVGVQAVLPCLTLAIIYYNSHPPPRTNRFTDKECDSESGNDYFGARYYASSMGRMLQPHGRFSLS
jgi:hypothetical protein